MNTYKDALGASELFLPSVKFIERHAFVIYEECPNAVEAMCGESEQMDVGASPVHPEGPPMIGGGKG